MEPPALQLADVHPCLVGQIDDVVQNRCGVLLSGDDDLSNGPCPGQEQFLDGVPPLDAIAAQAAGLAGLAVP